MRRVVAVLIGLVGLSAWAPAVAQTIYKCKGADGVMIYASTPCDATSSEVETKRYVAPPSAAPAQPAPGRLALINRCEGKWPGDYRMQQHCIEQQTAAARAVGGIHKQVEARAVRAEMELLAQCALQWQEGETYDYRMVQHCWEKQSAARQAVARERGE